MPSVEGGHAVSTGEDLAENEGGEDEDEGEDEGDEDDDEDEDEGEDEDEEDGSSESRVGVGAEPAILPVSRPAEGLWRSRFAALVGTALLLSGREGDAKRTFALGMRDAEARGDGWALAHLHKQIGVLCGMRKRFREAQRHLRIARAGYKRQRCAIGVAAAAMARGAALTALGRLRGARRMFAEARSVYEAENHTQGRLQSLTHLAIVLHKLPDVTREEATRCDVEKRRLIGSMRSKKGARRPRSQWARPTGGDAATLPLVARGYVHRWVGESLSLQLELPGGEDRRGPGALPVSRARAQSAL